jgi:hypothetical protein
VTPEWMLEGAVIMMSKSGYVASVPDTGYGNLESLDVGDSGNPVKASKGLMEAAVVVGIDPVLGVWAERLIKSPVGPEMPMPCRSCLYTVLYITLSSVARASRSARSVMSCVWNDAGGTVVVVVVVVGLRIVTLDSLSGA